MPVRYRHARRNTGQPGAAMAQNKVINQHHAKQRRKHRADKQQEVLILG